MVMPCSRSACSPSTSKREIEPRALRAEAARVGFERAQLILEHAPRFVQQASDQRGLAVVHAAAGDEAKQRTRSEVALPLLLLHRARLVACRSAVPCRSEAAAAAVSAMISAMVRAPGSRWRRSADSSPACGTAPAFRIGCSPGSSGEIDRRRRGSACHCAPRPAVPRRSRAARSGCSRVRCSARYRARSSSTAERREWSRPDGRAGCRSTTARGAAPSGSQRWPAARNEQTRSFAREASSSRRAPPKMTSKPMRVERLSQRLGLHDVGVVARAVGERVDARGQAGLVAYGR